VHLIDGGKALARKSIRDTHKGWPDPPVEQSDLPIDQARRDDVGRVKDASEHGEDLMAGRVSPPATPDRPTDDLFCQIRHRPASGLQHHPLLAHPVQRIHEPDSNTRPGLGDSCICAESSKARGRREEVDSDLPSERFLRQPERASLGVPADRPCLSRVDHAPAQRLDPLHGLGEVAHREVGQGDRIAGAAPAGMNADRGRSRVRLPALSLSILASLQLNAEELRPEASRARGIVGGKLDE
jgi:hypothetical protein